MISRELADGLELMAVAESHAAHVFVKLLHLQWFQLTRVSIFPDRRPKARIDALAPHRTDDVERPGGALVQLTSDRENAFVRVIRQLHFQSRNRIRQNERFTNFKILNGEGPPIEQLRAGFQHYFNKTGRRKYDEIFDLVILQEGHLSAIEPHDPCWYSPGQTSVEHSAAPDTGAALAPIVGFVPPAAPVPGIGRQRKQASRGDYLCKI